MKQRRIRWLSASALEAIQRELITRYGGRPGLRDARLLESAVARPKQIASYKGRTSIAELAAACGWGLLRNHPFHDGNKRIALAAMVVFLDLNGYALSCSEAEETAMVLRAAAGEMREEEGVEWVRGIVRRKG